MGPNERFCFFNVVQIVAGKGCVEQPTWFIIGDLIVIDFFSLFYVIFNSIHLVFNV